jgi:hypothetical protein
MTGSDLATQGYTGLDVCYVVVVESQFYPSSKALVISPNHLYTKSFCVLVVLVSFYFVFSSMDVLFIYSGMFIKVMKGDKGMELIMFYGSKTQ